MTQKKEVIPKRTILVTEQKEPITYIKKNVKKLGKPIRFHSGILESDHDDSDNEKKKKEKILHKLKDDSELFKGERCNLLYSSVILFIAFIFSGVIILIYFIYFNKINYKFNYILF